MAMSLLAGNELKGPGCPIAKNPAGPGHGADHAADALLRFTARFPRYIIASFRVQNRPQIANRPSGVTCSPSWNMVVPDSMARALRARGEAGMNAMGCSGAGLPYCSRQRGHGARYRGKFNNT